MREMRCSLSLREEYVEVVKHWLWKVEESFIQVPIPKLYK
jgi:hypothetical protein